MRAGEDFSLSIQNGACKENSPIGEPLGEDRGVVALMYIHKIGNCVEVLPC